MRITEPGNAWTFRIMPNEVMQGVDIATNAYKLLNARMAVLLYENTNAGIGNVVTVYPDVFNRIRKHTGVVSYNYADAVSADIASIKATAVFDKLQTVLRHEEDPLNRTMEEFIEADIPGSAELK